MAGLLGAETATLSGMNVAQEIVEYARARNVTRVIVGKPLHARWRDLLHGSLVYEIIRRCGTIDVQVITGEEGAAAPRRMRHCRQTQDRLAGLSVGGFYGRRVYRHWQVFDRL